MPLERADRARLRAIQLVATDIDGTLTRHGRLSGDVLDAMSALVAAGIEVLPVSGRPAGEVLGLARYLPGVRRALAENGLCLVRPGVEVRALYQPPDRDRLRAAATSIAAGSTPLSEAEDAFCRLCDLAFEREGRTDAELVSLRERAEAEGVQLIWSNVHIHLSLDAPDKGAAVLDLCRSSALHARAILAIGDAPNDAGFWLPGRFGVAVGCAQVMSQTAVLRHLPEFLVAEAGDGWLEMARALLAAREQGPRSA